MTNPNGKTLESWIWDAACSIRGAQEAPKFKDFILPISPSRYVHVTDAETHRPVAKILEELEALDAEAAAANAALRSVLAKVGI